MVIQVTQEDVECSSHEGDSCPVFRAISRKLPKVVYVGNQSIHFIERFDFESMVELPSHVKAWIRGYDNEKAVKPFEFEI